MLRKRSIKKSLAWCLLLVFMFTLLPPGGLFPAKAAYIEIVEIAPSSVSVGGAAILVRGTGVGNATEVRVVLEGTGVAPNITSGPIEIIAGDLISIPLRALTPTEMQGAEERQATLYLTDGDDTATKEFKFIADPVIDDFSLNNEVRFIRDNQGNLQEIRTELQVELRGERLNHPLKSNTLLIGGYIIKDEDLRVQDYGRLSFKMPEGLAYGPENPNIQVILETIYGARVTQTEAALYSPPNITALGSYEVQPGDKLGIIGTGFDNGTGDISGTTVDIGGRNASVLPEWKGVVSDAFLLTVEVPQIPNIPGKKDVRVALDNKATTTLVNELLVLPIPGKITIDSIERNYGPVSGGNQVTISGSGFENNRVVLFDGVPVPANQVVYRAPQAGSDGAQTLTVTVPASLEGRKIAEVVVQNTLEYPTNKSEAPTDPNDPNYLNNKYHYISSPKVTKIYPDLGPREGGQFVLLEGEDFYYDEVVDPVSGDTKRYPIVTLAGIDVEPLDPEAPGYEDLLRLFTKEGENLGETKSGKAGQRIIFQTPQAPNFLTFPAKVDLQVTNADRGTVKKVEAYTYMDPSEGQKPTATSVTPQEGNITGGTAFTIRGDAFGQNMLVTFDGVPATNLRRVDIKTLTGVTPPGLRADVPVPVQILDLTTGGMATLSEVNGYTYRLIHTAPKITKFEPTHGGQGTIITITGVDFVRGGNGIPSSRVYLGAYEIRTPNNTNEPNNLSDPNVPPENRIYVVSDTMIRVLVPNLGSAGEYALRVVNPDTASATATTPFKYQIPASRPKIDVDGISPNKGTTAGGTIVTIAGEDFRDGVEVYIGGYRATIVKAEVGESGTRKVTLTVRTAGIPGDQAGIKDVMVVNPDGGNFIMWDAFTYVLPDSEPRITRIDPNTGPASGGQKVVITGSDFRTYFKPEEEPNYQDFWPTVTIGGAKAEVVDFTSDYTGDRLTIITPPSLTPGKKDVVLTNYDTSTITVKDGYTYVQSLLKITSLVPDKASKAGDTVVIINGENFMLPRDTGSGLDPKTGTRVFMESDAKGDGGNWVEVPLREVELTDNSSLGTGGFSTEAPGKTVDSDGSIVTQDFPRVEILDGKTIRIFTLPQMWVGKRNIRLLNPDFAEANTQIRIMIPNLEPQITGLTPNSGTTAGGTPVKVTGENFPQDLKVYLGGKAATVTHRDPAGKWVIIRTPAGNGIVDLTVVDPAEDGGSDTLIGCFEYRVPQTSPKITKVEPKQGPLLGGTAVTITGANFRGKPNNPDPADPTKELQEVQVFFGTEEAVDVKWVNSNTLTCVTPAQLVAGAYDVVVINVDPNFGETSLVNGFTYLTSKLTVTNLFPDKIVKAGNTSVKVTGSGFEKPLVDDNGDLILDSEGNPVNPGTRVWMQTDVDDPDLEFVELTGEVLFHGVNTPRVRIVDENTLVILSLPQGDSLRDNQQRIVRFVNQDGGAVNGILTVVYPEPSPSITGVTPNEGPLTGGTLVTITGQDFKPQVEVYLDGKKVELVSRNSAGTELVIRIPAGKESDLGKKLDITVINPEDWGSDTWPGAWQYRRALSDVKIISVTPNSGPTKGGQLVTIKGENFKSNAEVYFGTLKANEIKFVDYQTLTCRTPAQRAGVYDVTVRHPAPDYGEATLRNGYTYGQEGPEDPIPGDFTAKLIGNRYIKLEWQPVPGATSYDIYVSTTKSSNEGDFVLLANTTETEYTLREVQRRTDYYFKLRAVSDKAAVSGLIEADPYPLSTGNLDRYEEQEDWKPASGHASSSDWEYWLDRLHSNAPIADSIWNLSNNTLNIIIGTQPLNLNYQENLDLTGSQYSKATAVQIYVPMTVARRNSGPIAIKTAKFNLEFPSNAFYNADLKATEYGAEWANNQRNIDQMYLRLTVRPINQQQISGANEKLGRNMVVANSVEVLAEIQVEAKTKVLSGNFARPMDLTLKATAAQWSSTESAGMYSYNPANRQWNNAYGSTNPVSRTGQLAVSRQGAYALIIQKR